MTPNNVTHLSHRKPVQHRPRHRQPANTPRRTGDTGEIRYMDPADRAATVAAHSQYVTEAAKAIGDATVKVAARYADQRWRIAANLATPEGFAFVVYLTAHNFRRPDDVATVDDEDPYRLWLPGSVQDIGCATFCDAVATLARLRGERSLITAAAPTSWTRPDSLIVGATIRHTRTGRTGTIMSCQGAYPIAVRWDDTGKTVYTTQDTIQAR